MLGVTHVNVLFIRGEFEVCRDVDLLSLPRYTARWKMCIDYKIFVTEPFPFDPHEGFRLHFVRVVAMLVHVEMAIVTVVSAASTDVAQLGVAVKAGVTVRDTSCSRPANCATSRARSPPCSGI